MGSQLSWLEHTPDKREVDGPSPFEPTTRKGNMGEHTQLTKPGCCRVFGLRKSGHMIAKQSYGLSRFEQDGKASTVVEDFGRLTTAQQDKKVFFLKGKRRVQRQIS